MNSALSAPGLAEFTPNRHSGLDPESGLNTALRTLYVLALRPLL